MKRIKVGLDLDGVVYDFIGPFDKYLIEKGYHIDPRVYDRGLDRELVKNELELFSTLNPFKWIDPIAGSLTTVKRLERDIDFHVVTHRGWCNSGIKDTVDRLKSDGIIYKTIDFSGKKEDFAKKYNLDYFIEDSLDNAKKIIENSNTEVFLLDQPYNRNFEHPKIIRVKSLEEIMWRFQKK